MIRECTSVQQGGRNMKIQPAVKKETGHIACWSGAGTIVMIVAFAVCHKLFPEAVPFDYKVGLGGIIGAAVAVGNFFIMRLYIIRIENIIFSINFIEKLYLISNKLVTNLSNTAVLRGSFFIF